MHSAPLSAITLTWYALPRFTAIAFLIIFWQAGTLFSTELSECPVFGNASYFPIKSDSGSFLTPSKSSSKVFARNCPRTTHTRSATESPMFAFAQTSAPPLNITRPSDTAISVPPIFFTSKERVFSKPK